MKERTTIGRVHMHSKDLFDSENSPERVCAKLAEMNAKGFAITQHGVLSAVELFRDEAAKYGLKYIPGIETYFDNGLNSNCHMILLAKDIEGYHAISKAVSKYNNKKGYAVMNSNTLDEYFAEGKIGHNHIIATTACINGVLAMLLRYNETIQKQIDKLEKKKEKGISPDDSRVVEVNNKIAELNADIENAILKIEQVQKLANMKFAKREKYLEKLEGEELEREREILEKDKARSKQAKQELEEAKREKATLLKRKSAFQKEAKAYAEKSAIYVEATAEIEKLQKTMKSEEEMKEEVRKEARRLENIFGKGNFFIEIQYHRIPMEKEIYPVLADIARELGIPIVAANDEHMVDNTEEERLRRQILKALRFGQWEEEAVGDSELYIKSDEELIAILSEIFPKDIVEEAMANLETIIDACNVVFTSENHYPKYSKTGDAEEIFDKEIEKGIKWRFPDGFPSPEYEERLAHEIKIIKKMQYVDYHLIVKDFLEYGRLLGAVPTEKIAEAPLTIPELQKLIQKNGWSDGFTTGPGRGSAVGSLVCYSLGITHLDPIKYGLLFERFLNPERVSMPDIDSDLANNVRPKVIDYVTNKYGKNAVCGILTMNAQAPRGAIRIAGKYYGQKIGMDLLSLSDKIAKTVPAEPYTKFDTETEYNGETMTVMEMLKKVFSDDISAEILRWASLVEGCFTVYGAHAAGVVISDNEDVSDYIPLRWNDKLQEWTTQCDMVKVEENGLLKMDFLGLQTLDIITETKRMIEKKTGKVINLQNIPIDDTKVYKEIFQKGNTNSVFQFESAGMKQMLKRFKPENFEDLIILVSMFRPGPLQFIDGVIDVKNGKEPQYLTEKLIPILGKTYGAIVYQEQVMQIFQDLAGYTLGGADNVRRYMSKKKMDKLAHEKEAFIYGDESRNIPGCIANGIDENAAEKLFEQMSDFAKYAFNKSHAAAYAYNAYLTGWLKYYYPAEFLASAMNWATNKKIPGLMHEAKIFGISVEAPNVNKAEDRFTVVNGSIIYGMKAVKSVGSAAETILSVRENGRFTSIRDFFTRCNINKKAIENLIKAGSFDCFCDNRQAMLAVIEEYKKAVKKLNDAKATEDEVKRKKKVEQANRSLGEIILPIDIHEDKAERMKEEKEYLGAYVTDHPLSEYPDAEEQGCTPIDKADGKTKIFGVISEVEIKKRKKDGKEMAFIKLEDRSGEIDVIFFTKQYELFKDYISEGNVVIIQGEAREEESNFTDDDGNPIMVTKYYPDDIEYAIKKKKEFVMTVSSYASFHIYKEESFIKKYGKEDGHILKIYDQSIGEIRKAKYFVSEDVEKLPNCN